jgi:hypothetical protein
MRRCQAEAAAAWRNNELTLVIYNDELRIRNSFSILNCTCKLKSPAGARPGFLRQRA